MAKNSPDQIVMALIEWVDSISAEPGWRWLDDAVDSPPLSHCKTIGWIINENDEEVRLAETISTLKDDYQVNGVIAIPVKSIIRREVLTSSAS